MSSFLDLGALVALAFDLSLSYTVSYATTHKLPVFCVAETGILMESSRCYCTTTKRRLCLGAMFLDELFDQGPYSPSVPLPSSHCLIVFMLHSMFFLQTHRQKCVCQGPRTLTNIAAFFQAFRSSSMSSFLVPLCRTPSIIQS
ncbi:hypothetical protein DL96DRAFT_1194767 [Flagelloscypha sp. PMI_526]|nr:hypothetical protein DL96DRAFT_1194767 [Flagelloscypha sp. PMI_526]